MSISLHKNNDPILKIENLSVGFGKKLVLDGLNMNINSGEIVAILGRNGSGKSTLLNTIMSIVPSWEGEIVFDHKTLSSQGTNSIIKSGLSFMPQGARIFPELSIYQNLVINDLKRQINNINIEEKVEAILAKIAPNIWDIARKRILGNLHEVAGMLSGGERQILCIIRSLLTEPKILLLDEPTIGLSPTLMLELRSLVSTKVQSSNSRLSVLFVEQKVKWALSWCQRVYILQRGKIVYADEPEMLLKDEKSLMGYLGLE